MTVYVSDYTAILSGTSWTETDATPIVVTYSFDTSPQSYLGGTYGTYSQAFIDSFQPFNDSEIAMAHDALAQWAEVSGLTFIEVAPGEGDITFGNYDFSLSSSPSAAGFAYNPARSVLDHNTYDIGLGGDVFIASVYMDASWLLDTLLHEIGHAIGLDHPFEGDIQLEAAVDSTSYTVMAYEGGYAPVLGSLDIAAAQALYGPDTFAPGPDGGITAFSLDETAFSLDQAWGAASSQIIGTSLHDRIEAGAGDDLVGGFRGDDLLMGEAGRDTLIGSEGADTLNGGAGNDVLIGGETTGERSGTDAASFAGASADLSVNLGIAEGTGGVQGSASGADIGTDTLYGIDNAIGGDGHDALTGNGWGNALEGGAGRDSLIGLAGDDTLLGDAGRDRLVGGTGDDSMSGGTEQDTMLGGNGDDVMMGDDGNDVLRGNGNHDLEHGGTGNDIVIGGTGRDTLYGDAGDDTLRGNGGFDTVNGGNGDDFVVGGAQADLLLGSAGNDTVQGGGGFDTIDGGAGDDLLTGNFNADRFVFADGHGNDTITDFEATNNAERIDLSDIGGIAGLADLGLGSATLGAATQAGADVVIDTGDGGSITLLGVSLGDLDASDFIF